MIHSCSKGFAPSLLGRDNQQKSSSVEHSAFVSSARPTQASELTDETQDLRTGLSKKEPRQAEESAPVNEKPNPHGLRHEWKLVAGRTGAKREPVTTSPTEVGASRENLQHSLAKLKDRPYDRDRQDSAHAAIGRQPMPAGHHAPAVIHKALRIGVAGALQTFGLGRTLGVHVGTKAVPLGSTPGIKNFQQGAAQLGFGAVGGAIGNLVGETLVAPVVNQLPRQFQPIDVTAVLPDRMVAKMNRIRCGWGHEMRATLVERQQEILQLSSNTNVRFGEVAFSAATVARLLLQPKALKLTLPRSLALNCAVSAVAGGAVGVNMGLNMARSAARIPRMETLDRVLADDWHEMSEAAAMEGAQSLPLFYSHVTPASQRRSIRDAISNNWHLGNIRDPAPAPWHPNDRIVYQSQSMQLQNIGADIRNTGQSIACRSAQLMHATAAQVAIVTLQPFVVSSMPNEFSARAASLVLPAIAIKMVIRPWFTALTNDIPRHDATMRAERQQAVDATEALVSNGRYRSSLGR